MSMGQKQLSLSSLKLERSLWDKNSYHYVLLSWRQAYGQKQGNIEFGIKKMSARFLKSAAKTNA